jgi:hypothetical protein
MSSKYPPPQYTRQNSIPTVTVTSPTTPNLKTPRTARFAEATAVNSPIDGPNKVSNPFRAQTPPTNHYLPQPQVSDLGFGYLHGNRGKHESVEMDESDETYMVPQTPRTPGPLKSPLKSALKSPGAAPRNMDQILSPTFTIMSPTWMEEQDLEKAEKITTKEQKRDLVSSLTETDIV